MKCPHCQADNPEGVKYCGECGKSLQDELVCPQCGHPNPIGIKFCHECGCQLTEPVSHEPPATSQPSTAEPTSFVNDRYKVKKKLGEGGKKKVYLVHDKVLDRDVAFALIKTENLDQDARKRVTREAQAMGKLGDNPHIVSIFDMGEINDQPYIVIPLMGGGDVEGLIEKAPDHKLPLDQTISIARAVCQGLVFAHSKGVIHRDLKPGNVWLTDDGSAKIGDFGLAVMIDVSRLTMEGMMVGTVSYMPPEQAMGGEVTPKADLYSLGAMLYEMVTGRPPFVGDDSVSIIGQHINTQPISPTWHRADLPPAFESLIMLLLEKDPEKRPGSAKDVLAALESIQKGAIREKSVETQAPTENPLYRRIFVGRENELKQLQNAFDGATSGRGALMMVVGEPGIGKTAVCDQLSTFVTLKGGKTLTGNCYEEGSLSLPYLAFVEAIRSYVLDRDTEDLKKELGSGATDVARIVSEIREKLHLEPREAQNPEEDRYRLIQAVTSFLRNAAAVKPMLVILEDLHDADKGTLEMLSYVSRNLSGTRLLLVGTYRDVEVDRNHPLSAALAELRRISTFGRVLLRGLNVDEVRRMLSGITREEIPHGLADVVHRQTEGNPLFVQEVIRYLAEEGLIQQEEGKWKPAKDTPLEMNIPEGLRDVIGKRLTLLSKECNQLLSIAAVIGREFSLDTLRLITDIDEDTFINALKEAIQTAVLEERKQVGLVHYRFTHAFFRQTLYEEMIAPQRLRLHQQVARALEKQYEKRLAEHAAELAEHFSQSTDPADLEKAVKYGEMAAVRAMNVYAYGEAVRLLDQTIKVQEILDPDNKVKRFELMFNLCETLLNVPDVNRIIDTVAPEAFSLAESIGDNDRIIRVCLYAYWAIFFQSGMTTVTSPSLTQWVERADRYALPGTIGRVYADLFKATSFSEWHNLIAREELIFDALDLARHLEDPDAITYACQRAQAVTQVPRYVEKRLQIAEEFMAMNHSDIKNRSFLTGTLRAAASAFLMSGKRDRAEEVWDEICGIAGYTEDTNTRFVSVETESVRALLDGHLEEAVAISDRLRMMGEEDDILGIAIIPVRSGGFRAYLYMGISPEDLEEWHPDFWNPEEMWAGARQSLMLAHWGEFEKVSEILERDVINRPGIGTDEDSIMTWMDTFFFEASILAGHKKVTELLYNRLNIPGLYTNGTDVPTSIPRQLGNAAVLLGKPDDAREHYKTSFRICTEMNFRPELALTHLNFAELLLDYFPKEKAEALEHLDFAIKEFREMKMQPSLERALRRKDILKA
ncbi:MAG: protein kinase [Dehalococcoidales bacterium]|nr:protein kinase [Dehalococcoidales bacterium]